MKTIGFIDYYLDEWHANNYPNWIKESSGGEVQVKYAWGKIDSPLKNALTNKNWAEKMEIELSTSIEELVEKSDYIIVLSPDNSEMHPELCEIALKSSKPVFVDKTFADSKEIAIDLFQLAQKNNTPMFSTSALRFATEYENKKDVVNLNSFGGGSTPRNYLVHQLEPIAILMGTDVEKVMCLTTGEIQNFIFNFSNRNIATLTFNPNIENFEMKITTQNTFETVVVSSDFFKVFILELLKFFQTKIPPVKSIDTIEIMSIREACLKAMETTKTWIDVK